MEKKVLARLNNVKDQMSEMDNRELKRLYDALDVFEMDEGIVRRLRNYGLAVFDAPNDILTVTIEREEKTMEVKYRYYQGRYRYMQTITAFVDGRTNYSSGQGRGMSEDDVVKEIIAMNI